MVLMEFVVSPFFSNHPRILNLHLPSDLLTHSDVHHPDTICDLLSKSANRVPWQSQAQIVDTFHFILHNSRRFLHNFCIIGDYA